MDGKLSTKNILNLPLGRSEGLLYAGQIVRTGIVVDKGLAVMAGPFFRYWTEHLGNIVQM